MASVISIGHISTLALAAATLGSMTASVTGYTIVQGFVSTLDTLLPPAWTSDRPHMVGLWSQRMGSFFLHQSMTYNTNQSFETVLLTGMILIVCSATFQHIEFSVILPFTASISYLAQSRTYSPRSQPRA